MIRASAHAALDELREVVSLLRGPIDQGEDHESAVLRPPQPTLADVSALVEESRQAGMSVRFHARLDHPGAVPDAIGRTVYRVVQEGLTNARKHAPTSVVEVRIADDNASALDVSVLTCPPVDDPAVRTPHLAGASTPPAPGTGMGLIGLAERVALANGRLEHAPSPDGGYALSVTLPVPR